MEAKDERNPPSRLRDTPAEVRNHILAALPKADYERLKPHLTRLSLENRQIMFDVNSVITDVYFPENCVVSIIGLMTDGSAVETATVGNEGMVGMPIFHGTDRTSSQAFCQVPGLAWKLPAEIFREELKKSDKLNLMLHRYSQALFALVGQSSGCNRLHSMRQRCARWLLLTHDRVGASRGVSQFPLAQQFLSQMLGVRQGSVTEAISVLSETGAITYEMGLITVLERSRLEAHSCECYQVIRSEFHRLLGDTQSTAGQSKNPLDGMRTSDNGKSTVGDAVPNADMEN